MTPSHTPRTGTTPAQHRHTTTKGTTMRRRTTIVIATVCGLAVGLPAGAATFKAAGPPKPTEYTRFLPAGQDNPMIADGVALGSNLSTYQASGLGPTSANPSAPAGSAERYIDAATFPGGTLPQGVTVTEAQGLNVLEAIGDNLERAGLDYDDVTTMRVFLSNPKGAETADFNGWNRAYRQYFANTSLSTGKPIPVSMGTAAPKNPIVTNSARPSRFAVEVENLPVQGWLVEVEVTAAYPKGNGKK